MPPNYNPNSTLVRGLEVRSRGLSTKRVGSAVEQAIIRWRSAATPLTALDLMLDGGTDADWPAGPAPAFGAENGTLTRVVNWPGGPRTRALVDVMARGSELQGAGNAVTFTDYAVTAVDAVSPDTGGTFALFRNAADSAAVVVGDLTAADASFAQTTPAVPNAVMGLRFTSSAFPANRHVIGIEFLIRAKGSIHVMRQRWHAGSSVWANELGPRVFSSADWTTHVYRVGEAFPERLNTSSPIDVLSHWTQARVTAWSSSTGRRLRIASHAGAGTAIDHVVMRVYSVPERRLSLGFVGPLYNWSAVPLILPADGAAASIATTVGADYSLIVRRPVPGNDPIVPEATVVLRRLTKPWAAIPNLSVHAAATVDLKGSYQPETATAAEDVLPAVRLWNGTTLRDDSLVYRGFAVDVASPLETFIDIPGAARTYRAAYVLMAADFVTSATAWVEFKLRQGPGDTGPESPVARVFKADVDSSPAVGEETVSIAGVARTVTWRRVRLDLGAGVALLAGTLARLRVSTTTGATFLVAALAHQNAVADRSQSYNADQSIAPGAGTFDAVTPGLGLGEHGDYQATVNVVPPPPSPFHATAPTFDYAGQPTPAAQLGWVPPDSTLPEMAGIAHYELQRSDDRTGWATIATLAAVGTSGFVDHEARIGVRTYYRIRTARADGTEGPWATAPALTLAAPDRGLLYLSANGAPTLSVALPDVYDGSPARGFAFPEAEEVVRRTIYGRDLPVAFRPVERRGVAFSRRLALPYGRACPRVGVPGPGQFDTLRDLAASTVDHVTVRDSEGNRWGGALSVAAGEIRLPSGMHAAAIEFFETAEAPGVVGASGPLVESNLLTPNQSQIETDTSGWEKVLADSTSTFTLTKNASVGQWDAVQTTTGLMVVRTVGPAAFGVAAVPGATYVGYGTFVRGSGAYTTRFGLQFVNATGAIISTAYSASIPDPGSGVWKTGAVEAVAPAGTAYLRLMVEFTTTVLTAASGDAFYVVRSGN